MHTHTLMLSFASTSNNCALTLQIMTALQHSLHVHAPHHVSMMLIALQHSLHVHVPHHVSMMCSLRPPHLAAFAAELSGCWNPSSCCSSDAASTVARARHAGKGPISWIHAGTVLHEPLRGILFLCLCVTIHHALSKDVHAKRASLTQTRLCVSLVVTVLCLHLHVVPVVLCAPARDSTCFGKAPPWLLCLGTTLPVYGERGKSSIDATKAYLCTSDTLMYYVSAHQCTGSFQCTTSYLLWSTHNQAHLHDTQTHAQAHVCAHTHMHIHTWL